MKSFINTITLGLVATCISAAPFLERDAPVKVYHLTVSSDYAGLNGKALSLSNSTVVVSPGLVPLQFYITQDPGSAGLSSLHTYPIGIIDHTLALVGNGLQTFRDIANTNKVDADVDTSFSLDGTSVTNDAPGSWIAFPTGADSWTVNWYDGSSFITDDYIPVDVLYSCDDKTL